MMSRVSGSLSFERATMDLQRVTRDLQDLQRQMSGSKANDLKTFSSAASSVVSARSAVAEAVARQEAARLAEGRLAAQDAALNRAHDVTQEFKEKVLKASSNMNGIGLRAALEFAVKDLAGAMNLQWDGQYTFGGDRETAPVKGLDGETILTTDPFQLVGAPPNLALGDGQIVPLGEGADTISRSAFVAFRMARELMGDDGQALEGELSDVQLAGLQKVAAAFETARAEISAATGRNGEAQRAVDSALVRLETRQAALENHLGRKTDADLAEVAVELSQKRSQYEAIARVIGELRDLNLLNYLRS